MLTVKRINDDFIFLECSCGEEFECPSFYKQAICYGCGSKRNLFDAREDYLDKMIGGSVYSADLKLKTHRVRNKLYDRYGNIAQLVKKLRLDK
jgi:hypothetical protein